MNRYHKTDDKIKTKYYLENREKVLQRCKEYREKHSEKYKEYNRLYYQKNKEKIDARCKKYFEEHREEVLNKIKECNYRKYHNITDPKPPKKPRRRKQVKVPTQNKRIEKIGDDDNITVHIIF